MKVAVISDVHGNRIALEAVLDDIAAEGVDATLALGDFLSGAFDPVGVADILVDLALPSVRGNHDRHIVEGREKDWEIDALVRKELSPAHKDWLAALPLNRVFAGEVFMCHGTPAADDVLWLDGTDADGTVFHTPRAEIEQQAKGFDYPVLLCGHSHIPRSLRLADGRLVVNPGSVGLPFSLGSPDARYALLEKRGNGWTADLRALPYDASAAAAQARDRGFEKWATAVTTGWLIPGDL